MTDPNAHELMKDFEAKCTVYVKQTSSWFQATDSKTDSHLQNRLQVSGNLKGYRRTSLCSTKLRWVKVYFSSNLRPFYGRSTGLIEFFGAFWNEDQKMHLKQSTVLCIFALRSTKPMGRNFKSFCSVYTKRFDSNLLYVKWLREWNSSFAWVAGNLALKWIYR